MSSSIIAAALSLLLAQAGQDDLERARALAKQRRFTEAWDVYRRLMPADRDLTYEAARTGAWARDTGGALGLIDPVLARDPKDREMRVLRAAVLQWSGDLEAAERECRTVLEADPGYSPAHVRLGYVLLARGHPTGAREAFQAALKLDASDREARRGLATARSLSGEAQDAEKELRDLLEKDRDAETLLELARLLRRTHRPAEAEPLYTEYLAQRSEDQDARRERDAAVEADTWGVRSCLLYAVETDFDDDLDDDAAELRTIAWRTTASRRFSPQLFAEAGVRLSWLTLENLITGDDNYSLRSERLWAGVDTSWADDAWLAGARVGFEHFSDAGSATFELDGNTLFAPLSARLMHRSGPHLLVAAYEREPIPAQLPNSVEVHLFHRDRASLVYSRTLSDAWTVEGEIAFADYSRDNTEFALSGRAAWRANDWLTVRPTLTYRNYREDVPFYYAFDDQWMVAAEAEARRRWERWEAAALYRLSYAVTHEEVNPETFVGLPTGVEEKTTTNIIGHRLRLEGHYRPHPRFSARLVLEFNVNSDADQAWSAEVCADVRF